METINAKSDILLSLIAIANLANESESATFQVIHDIEIVLKTLKFASRHI